MGLQKRLYFEYTKFGIVKKLCLYGVPVKQAQDACSGASPAKDRMTIRFPLEELYARRLIRLIPGLVVEKAVEVWLDGLVSKVKYLNALRDKEDVELDFLNADKLYPFQRVDVQYMYEVPEVLNANQMGTGKTMECIGLMQLADAQNVLFVVSKSKLDDWAEEVKKWTGEDAIVIKGTPVQKQKLLAIPSRVKIMTHASLRGKKPKGLGPIDYGVYTELFLQRWDLVAIDEAHKMKNSKSMQASGARRLLRDRLVLLTGTPMLNSPKDLWSLLNLLYPDRFTSYWQFVERFCELEENPFSSKPNITGIKNVDALHYTLLPFTLRRKKCDIMAYLPDKIYKTIKLDMVGEQLKMYKQMKKEMVIDLPNGDEVCAPSTLTQMIRLRQLTLSPALLGGSADSVKTDALMEIIEECIESGEKLVVFSFFKGYIKLIGEMLTKQKIKFGMIHGETKDADREKSKKLFKDDPECYVFLCTITAGGEGLNLQHASTMVFTDKDYVPGIMEQCEDRIHRDGQLKNPLIISLTCRNSIDEYIDEIVNNKSAIITQGMAIKNILRRMRTED